MMIFFILRCRILLVILLWLSSILLCSCTTLSPSKIQPGNHHLSWQQRQQQLASITQWNMSGVMGISYAGKTDIINFNWQQNGGNYVIHLSGPLGLGSAKIVGNDDNVTLWKNATESISATSPEELIRHQFGWTLPIANLQSWILALPAEDIAATHLQFDPYNHLVQLQQENWRIKYAKFASSNNIDLPTTIYLNSTKQLAIKLVIKSFMVASNP